MCFAIDMEYVFGRYLDDSSEFKGRYFILDEDYEYIAGSGEGQLPELDAWEYELLKNGEVFRDKEQQTILTCVRAGGAWYVLVEYPIAEYSSNKLHAGTVVFIVLLLYCLIAGGLLVLFMDRIFARLNKIGSNLEEIGKKDFRFLNHLRGHDEISRLENQYNGMVETLSDTIAEMSEMQNKKQQLEIRVLESQINPHFLYNTLGVMQWKALETGDSELCKMIENMTTFYRLSMSKGLGLIPVEKEVEQIKAYIAIQQIRYDYCVDYRIEMEAEAKDILIPKMILQPLVENIYLHAGIVLEGRQKIRIKIYRDEEFLYIHVCDNGSGMDEKTLYNVNHNINLSEERGIGISFIYNSLDMYYSELASLHFQSSMGNGTTAKIKIPIMPMEV